MSLELANQILPNMKVGNRDRVTAIMSQLIADSAKLDKTWGGIARIATSIGEANLAAKAAELYVHTEPNNPQLQLSRAGILVELGQTEEAINLIEPLLTNNMQMYSLHHFLGIAKSQLGHLQDAEINLRAALKLKRNLGHTWLALSTLIKFTKNDKDIRKMESVIKAGKFIDITSESALYFAIAKAYMDTKQYPKALRYMQKGSKNMLKANPYDAAKDRTYVEELINSYSGQNLNKMKSSTLTYDPIFIIGLPRSGTTLLSQILVSHEDIVGAGELKMFSQAMMACNGYLLNDIDNRQNKLGTDKNALDEIGLTYQRLVSERFRCEGRIVDKTLNNARYLGAISKVFPNAKFIWINRDMDDTAWSCYRTFFSEKMNWTWSLKNIAEYFAMEDKLNAHWKSVFADKVFEVEYSELVTEPEAITKKIMAHCGLDYSEKLLQFYDHDNAVQTASVAQVREPIYTSALGMNENYSEFIQPFKDLYKKLKT